MQQVCEAERERDGEIESTPHTFLIEECPDWRLFVSATGASSGFYLRPHSSSLSDCDDRYEKYASI